MAKFNPVVLGLPKSQFKNLGDEELNIALSKDDLAIACMKTRHWEDVAGSEGVVQRWSDVKNIRLIKEKTGQWRIGFEFDDGSICYLDRTVDDWNAYVESLPRD